MEALNLKIFDVLTEKINVSEFENWLYNSEEFLDKVDLKTFYFDIVSINYKANNCLKKLSEIVGKEYGSDTYRLIDIKKFCSLIIESKTEEETYSVLCFATENFDFDTEFSILWEFYSLRDYFSLVRDGIWKIDTLQLEAKFHAEMTLKLFKENANFENLKIALNKELKPFKKEVQKKGLIKSKTQKIEFKPSLIKKIFAFLKKI